MPQPTLECGVRANEFWRRAVDREVTIRAKHKPGVIAGVVRDLQRAESSPSLGARPAQNADHGTILYSLHDLHRDKVQAVSSSASAVKLPPVKGAQAPEPVGGLWKWPGGSPLPADVESAVTAATPSVLPSSVLSAYIPQSSSVVSANAPRAESVLSAAPPSVLQAALVREQGSEVGTQLTGMSAGSAQHRGARRR
eukprot:gb/GFBE01064035.1/.p1 GENE.gb/GFBE01064035.1/~~gb/GFBE01064035.1/.p1  ORF type:complete len:196 (+),score=18.49 gb/GFBE01064035.1/:1-588(+)